MKKIILIFIIASLSFVYGLGIGFYKWFPFQLIKNTKNLVFDSIKKETKNINIVDKIDISTIRSQNKLINSNSILETRKKIKKKVITKIDKSKIKISRIDENSEKISIDIYENKINAILNYSPKPKNCLKIYIQGHGGNPFDYYYHNELLEIFTKNGCDVLSMSMLGIGLNEGPFSYPSKYGIIKLDKNQNSKHRNHALFFDKNNPEIDPLALFISPHYNIIKHLSVRYEKISMLGISGGGWYTVWLSAMLPKIDLSISYAGSLPMEYRVFDGVWGDWEQQNSNVYKDLSYWELYKLMTISKEGKENRKAFLIYNNNDSCCYYNPFAKHFKQEMENLNWNNLTVIIDDSNKHEINTKIISKIFNF